MNTENEKYYLIGAFLFTIAFISIPWPELFYNAYGHELTDRWRYRNQLETENFLIDLINFDGFFSYLTSEYLWHTSIAYIVRDLNVSVDNFFLGVSFFITFIFAAIVYRKAGIFNTLLLANPMVMVTVFSGIRLGVAISLLGLAYQLRSKLLPVAIIITCLTPFIHTGSILFIFLFFIAYYSDLFFLKSKDNQKYQLYLLIFAGAIVSVVTGPFRDIILSSVNDRRADYKDMSSSILYLSFWYILFFSLVMDYKKSLKILEVRYTISILAIVFFNTFFDGYSSRYLAVTFPFLIIAVSNVFEKNLNIKVLFVLYSIFQWLYWLKVV